MGWMEWRERLTVAATTIALAVVVIAVAGSILYACHPITFIRISHVDANVPASAEFDGMLRRDLLSYFQKGAAPTATDVEFTLLRKRPTQSGIAYPKYYLWVQVLDKKIVLEEGAVRVSAIDRVRFEVTDFVPQAVIRSDQRSVEEVFPQALVEEILAKTEQ